MYNKIMASAFLLASFVLLFWSKDVGRGTYFGILAVLFAVFDARDSIIEKVKK